MTTPTAFLESLHYVPEPGWTSGAFTALRAGKVAAAPFHELRRSSHPGQDLLYCVSGAGVVETGGQRLDVQPGQLVWIANETPHAHCASGINPWSVLWVRLDGPDPAAIRRKLFGERPPRVAVPQSANLESWFERLFVAMRSRELDIDIRLNLLISELFAILDCALRAREAARAPKALASLVAAMRGELGRQWGLEEMTAVTRLSASQIRRLFKRHFGASPHKWLQRERLMHAQALITQSDRPLSAVADLCGFCDVYHFSREFKRAVGASPGAWRRSEVGSGFD